VSSPSAGSGAEPQPKSNLMHFSLKIWHLVAAILTILLRINWTNLVLEMREISVTRNFQGYFSRTFQDLKLQFRWLSRSWNFQEKNPGLSRKRGNPISLNSHHHWNLTADKLPYRVAPNFGFGFGQVEIRPFFPNSAKFGFGQIFGRIWQTPMQLQCVQLVT